MHNGFKAFGGVVGAGATSPPLEIVGMPHVTAHGTTSAAAIITVQVSENGADWTDSDLATASGTAHYKSGTLGARHIRAKCSAAVTANIWLSCNG